MNHESWLIALPIVGMKSNILPVRIGPINIIRLKDNIPPGSECINHIAIAINVTQSFNLKLDRNIHEFLENSLAIFRLYVANRLHGLAALNIISKAKLWTYSELYSINVNDYSKSIRTSLRPGIRMYEYRLTQDDVNLFEEEQITEVLNLLLKFHLNKPITPLEEVIVKSTVWAGMMLEDVFYVDRFLRGVTAVETLFEKHKTKGIASKFKTLGSKLFYKYDQTYARAEIEESLNSIYKARCDISHAGKAIRNETKLSISDMQYLIANICYNAIKVWKSSSNLEDFYEQIELVE